MEIVALYDIGRMLASESTDFESFLATLSRNNGELFTEPLPLAEVERMAKKLWEYRQTVGCTCLAERTINSYRSTNIRTHGRCGIVFAATMDLPTSLRSPRRDWLACCLFRIRQLPNRETFWCRTDSSN